MVREKKARDRARDREGTACFGGGLNHLCGGSPSGPPLACHLALPGFGLTQGPACTSCSRDGMDSSTRVSGKLTGSPLVNVLLPLTPRDLSASV